MSSRMRETRRKKPLVDERSARLAELKRGFDREAWAEAYQAWQTVLRVKGLAFTDLFRRAKLFDPARLESSMTVHGDSHVVFSPDADVDGLILQAQRGVYQAYLVNELGVTPFRQAMFLRPAEAFRYTSPRAEYAMNFRFAADDPELFAAFSIYGETYGARQGGFGSWQLEGKPALVRLRDAARDYIRIRGLELDANFYLGDRRVTSLIDAPNASDLHTIRVQGTLHEMAVAATLEFIESMSTNPLVIFEFTDEAVHPADDGRFDAWMHEMRGTAIARAAKSKASDEGIRPPFGRAQSA